MSLRINAQAVEPAGYRALLGVHQYVHQGDLPDALLQLIYTRASQINGCAFCLDMHTRDALNGGETPQRLYTLSAYRETSFFTPAEKAALAFTESVTLLSEKGVSDEVYAEVAKYFEPKQIVQLIIAIGAINTWNRLAIATGMQPALAAAVSTAS